MLNKRASIILLGLFAVGVLFFVLAGPLTTNARNEDAPVVGGDWRVWRGYTHGTINKEHGISVLYFLFDNGELAFYLNQEVNQLALVVDLSKLPDPRAATASLSFEDVNGDGFNDLKIPMGEGLVRVWYWDTGTSEFTEAPEEAAGEQ